MLAHMYLCLACTPLPTPLPRSSILAWCSKGNRNPAPAADQWGPPSLCPVSTTVSSDWSACKYGTRNADNPCDGIGGSWNKYCTNGGAGCSMGDVSASTACSYGWKPLQCTPTCDKVDPASGSITCGAAPICNCPQIYACCLPYDAQTNREGGTCNCTRGPNNCTDPNDICGKNPTYVPSPAHLLAAGLTPRLLAAL